MRRAGAEAAANGDPCRFRNSEVTVWSEWWNRHYEKSVSEKLRLIFCKVSDHYGENGHVSSFIMDNIDVKSSLDQKLLVTALMQYRDIDHLSPHNISMATNAQNI